MTVVFTDARIVRSAIHGVQGVAAVTRVVRARVETLSYSDWPFYVLHGREQSAELVERLLIGFLINSREVCEHFSFRPHAYERGVDIWRGHRKGERQPCDIDVTRGAPCGCRARGGVHFGWRRMPR